MAAGLAAGQASAAQSCWAASDAGACGVLSAVAASSSERLFYLLLKTADGQVCTGTCASSTSTSATLNGAAGVAVAGTCSTGACIYKWTAPTTSAAGTWSLAGFVGGTAVATATVVITPGETGTLQAHADV